MSDEWKQISDLYHAALKLPENERTAFLQACIASDGVRREVASLLANVRTAEHLLESPALEVAARMKTDNAPVLTIGQTLGHYQIKLQLGKGGMGEVYRAHDRKLGRDVAIKTLPPEFARDPDRVARLHREAKLLASLNHPNIAAIYGLEESGETNFLVLELAEGPTLADRIKAGTIPVEESLKLALQIAEALEAAHEKEVIHRDLKPANIKVTPEGKVKVLDFGLAKAFAGEQAEVNLTNSPTLSNAATQQGVILGTAAYMSPEQARGKPVDKRADIWAFGCVLYEMLTGQAAFQGEDVTEILASVVKGDANLDLLPANLHPRVREVITRCLQKDLRRRYQGIADARYEIEQALAVPGGVLTQPVATTQPPKRLRTMLPWIIATAILGVTIGGSVVWKFKQAEPRLVIRSEYSLPANQQFTNLTGSMLAVSPDGRQYVYVTAEGLYLRSTDEFNARLIAGTGTSPANPFFSPDGKWIGYGADSKLKKIAIAGGEPKTLCDASGFMGGSWGTDNRIVYAVYQKGIYRISADAGTPVLIVKGVCFYPQLLPDGKSVLYTSGPLPYKIVVQSLQSGEPKELFAGKNARYISTGHLVYVEGSNLFARPFDYKTLKVTGEAVPVVEAVLGAAGIYTAHYAVSDSGTLVYIPTTGAVAQRTLVWVDRDANEIPIAAPPNDYHSPRISPDGTRVAVSVGGDIYIWDLIHRTLRRLTFERTNGFPLWTVDSKRLAFWSLRDGLYDAYWRSADGIAKEELLGAKLGLRSFVPADWADNGKTLVTTSWENNYMSGIGMLSMEGNRKFQFLLDEKHLEAHPRISPDGRWMVYTSSESGRNEIYIRSFPDMKVREQLTWSGGNSPLWSENAIFYRNGDSVNAVSVKTSPAFIFGTPRTLFPDTYVRTMNSPGSEDFETWDISPDGKKFLMMKDSSTGSGPRKINIVANWFEELKQRVPLR